VHVEAAPSYVEVGPGQPVELVVTVANTGTLIDAYSVQVLGVDAQWVTCEPSRLPLFPDESGTCAVTIDLPAGFPAGDRHLAVQVRSENEAIGFGLAQVALTVLSAPTMTLRVEPTNVIGGKHTTFSMIVHNGGNAPLDLLPDAVDPEDEARFLFTPTTLHLGPDDREVVEAEIWGRRPWVGHPKVRVVTFQARPLTAVPGGPPPAGTGNDPPDRPAVAGEPVAEAIATFVQKPRISRWLISLMGLLAAAAVFAAVLTRTLDQLNEDAARNQDLVLEALGNEVGSGTKIPADPGVVRGSVVSASTGTGVGGMEAELFSAANGVVPVATAATASDGTFALGNLRVDTYKLRLSGAGFQEIWFSDAVSFVDATEIEVELEAPTELPPIALGGRPGSVAGTVIADDPTGTTATLVRPGVIDPDTEAQVQQVDVSADGSFLFETVPSPATYQLVVSRPGSTTVVRDVVLGPGQAVDDIEVVLLGGDGVVSGTVTSPDGPLGAATVEATDGTLAVSTVTLTEGDLGAFALRGLPTPGRYTVTVTHDGFAPESLTVALTDGQQLTGLTVNLTSVLGSIQGTVSLAGTGPAGGVRVALSGGTDSSTAVATVSADDPLGAYLFEQLAVPGLYTLTFSGEGLVPQTRLVELDPVAGTANSSGIDATLITRSATLRGVVRNQAGALVATASALLTDGTDTRQTQTAHEPLGEFEYSGLSPGAYTLRVSLPGTLPSTQIVTLSASETAEVAVTLDQEASISGTVLRLPPGGVDFVPYAGATVALFPLDEFTGTSSPGSALLQQQTGADGTYRFAGLQVPDDQPASFVVAVYSTPDSASALDSAPVQSQPSTDVVVPTFRIRNVS
jgi:hypothetical protein